MCYVPLLMSSQLPQGPTSNRCCDSRAARNGECLKRISAPGLPDNATTYCTVLARIISICRNRETFAAGCPCRGQMRPSASAARAGAPTAKPISDLDGCRLTTRSSYRGKAPKFRSVTKLVTPRAAACRGSRRVVRPYRGGPAKVPSGSTARRHQPHVRTAPWSSTGHPWQCPGAPW